METLASTNQIWGYEQDYIYISLWFQPLRYYIFGLRHRPCHIPACVVQYQIWSRMIEMYRLYKWNFHLFQELLATSQGHQKCAYSTLLDRSDSKICKFHFFRTKIEYFGHLIMPSPLAAASQNVDESKIAFFSTTSTQVRSFGCMELEQKFHQGIF